MLDKLKVVMLVGVALQVLRNFFPAVEIPGDFQPAVETLINSLFVVIPVVAAWFKRESAQKVAKLQLNR